MKYEHEHGATQFKSGLQIKITEKLRELVAIGVEFETEGDIEELALDMSRAAMTVLFASGKFPPIWKTKAE